jgi:hypothetical protein
VLAPDAPKIIGLAGLVSGLEFGDTEGYDGAVGAFGFKVEFYLRKIAKLWRVFSRPAGH